ncbi:hypothetical protein RMR21_016160 [Agrobacterium sp. rho-8.1]|nr:hypothetical protein [Agrobacterium sp. rho-8.1]
MSVKTVMNDHEESRLIADEISQFLSFYGKMLDFDIFDSGASPNPDLKPAGPKPGWIGLRLFWARISHWAITPTRNTIPSVYFILGIRNEELASVGFF